MPSTASFDDTNENIPLLKIAKKPQTRLSWVICSEQHSLYLDNRKRTLMLRIKNYINGVFHESSSGELMDNYDPAIGQIYSQLPCSNSVDVE